MKDNKYETNLSVADAEFQLGHFFCLNLRCPIQLRVSLVQILSIREYLI